MNSGKNLEQQSNKKQKFQTKSEMDLISIQIPMKFIEFKISNKISSMEQTQTAAISEKGIVFKSNNPVELFSLLRIFIEIPNYWEWKAQKVDYKHTDAPSHFQILARVISSEQDFISPQHELVCEILNIDSVDLSILNDYITNNYMDKFV